MSKPYTPASKRADAPTGCAYVAPTFWNKWFRWDGSRASGCYQLGGQVKDENHTGMPISASPKQTRAGRRFPRSGQSQTFGRPRMISQNRRFTMSYSTASGRTSCFLTGLSGFRRFRESGS